VELFPLVLERTQDLTKDQIEYLLKRSEDFKNHRLNPLSLHQMPKLTNKTISLLFSEPSTRTKLSFFQAASFLEAKVIDIDHKQSSLVKGENIREMLKNLKLLDIDLAVVRTPHDDFFSVLKEEAPMALINAGNGISYHPTQALVDLFTFHQLKLKLDNKHLVIVGDTLHSRVANSLFDLFSRFGAKISVSCPEDQKESLPKDIDWLPNIDLAMDACDYLYLLRVQRERHNADDRYEAKQYRKSFALTEDRVTRHKFLKPFFHPGPVNLNFEIDESLLKLRNFFGYHQVKNGIYSNMAIMETLLEDAKIPRNLDLDTPYVQNQI
jgi:aspartate carbamoyltransferase catalytic subunit